MEKERELELREKLDEQRRVLEGEHEQSLQGKEGDAPGGRAWKRPSSVPTCRVHRGTPTGPPAYSGPQAAGCFRPGVGRIDLKIFLLNIGN